MVHLPTKVVLASASPLEYDEQGKYTLVTPLDSRDPVVQTLGDVLERKELLQPNMVATDWVTPFD